MQDIVTNMRGTRAFDRAAGKVVTLTLAATALGLASVASTQAANADHPAPVAVAAPPVTPHALTARRAVRHAARMARLAHRQPRVQVADYPPTAYTPKHAVRVASAALPLAHRVLTPAIGSSAPVQAPHPAKILTDVGTPADVTLDFVAADISDVLRALSIQTHTNIVSGPDVKGAITVSLAHVSLDDALNMISHLSGFQYAKVGNTYVVGTQASLASLTSNAPSAVPINVVIPFNYSDPTQLTQIITDRYPDIKVTQGKTSGSNSAGGVLVVTGQPTDIDAVRQLVADTEQGLSRDMAASQTIVYDIKYASADDLQSVLTRLVPDLIVTPGPSMRTAPIAPSTADAGGATSTTTSYGTNGAAAGGVVTSVTGNLPTKLTTMSLLLTGSADDIARAQTILAQVDVRPAQINFEATVADLDDTLARNLGLTYDFANAKTTIGELLQPGETPSSTVFSDPYPGQISKFRTFGRSPLDQFVTIGLQAAQQNGDARILATPNISAINGQPAAIFIGNNVTYISSITSSTTGENITTATASAGVKLFITGEVDNDGYITVNLHPEVSTLTLTPSIGGSQLPNIATREATTTLRVHDGDYIALGGLAQNQVTKTDNGVPILEDIPVLGYLFRSNSKTIEHRQLTIFIKVSIQKDGEVAVSQPQMPEPPKAQK